MRGRVQDSCPQARQTVQQMPSGGVQAEAQGEDKEEQVMCGQPICPTCRQPLTLIHGRYHCCNLECSAVVVLVENKETEECEK